MAMNFDTYSTSFQSLMKPMYNLNANYTLGMGGYPGAGAGMYGAGFMNPAMMGMYAMGPMANVGIGQFRADYLLQGEDQMNNYYARPVPVHKKENETGTILGIIGTALGTAALLAALAKGKFRGVRVPRPTRPTGGVNNPPIGPKPTTGTTTPGPTTPGPTTPGPKTPPAPTDNIVIGPRGGNTQNPPLGLPAPKGGNTQNPPLGLPAPKGGNTQNPPLGLPAPKGGNTQNPPLGLPAPKGGNTQNPPLGLPAPQGSQVAGYLPPYTSKMQNALNKQAAAMNLPSSGNVITAPGAIANTPAIAGAEVITPTTITMPKATNAPRIKYDWKSEAVDVPFFEVGPKASLPAPAKGGVPATTPKVELRPIQDYYNTGNQYNLQGGIRGFLPAQAS